MSGNTDDGTDPRGYECLICGYSTRSPGTSDCGAVRGNTEPYLSRLFPLWRCAECRTIYSVEPVDLSEIYAQYPLNDRQLDVFARKTLGNLLKRLVRNGVTPQMSVLDFGCGNGLFVDFLRSRGYSRAAGYDPFVPAYSNPPAGVDFYDVVVANDVIEHCDDPRGMFRDCLKYLKPGGTLYVGTADCLGVADMQNLEAHVMRLHQPFHRLIISRETLLSLGEEFDLALVENYERSYMDTLWPFANYRFLDELNRALDHNMNRALSSDAEKAVMTSPRLLFFGLMGYFYPSAIEPAAVWRKK